MEEAILKPVPGLKGFLVLSHQNGKYKTIMAMFLTVLQTQQGA